MCWLHFGKTILSQVTVAKDLSKLSQKTVEEIMEEAPPQIDENAPIPLISNLLHFIRQFSSHERGK
jgi:predicted transcriptional regulator